MRILILTTGKTGSTALTYLLKRNLWFHRLCFEPLSLHDIPDDSRLICKYFVKPHEIATLDPAKFDRVILLVRNPYDLYVSLAMYHPFNGGGFHDNAIVDIYIKSIVRKINDNDSLDFYDLFRFCSMQLDFNTADYLQRIPEGLLRTYDLFRDKVYLYRYEDMVSGKLDALADYLGISLRPDFRISRSLSRVRRTVTGMDYLNWFTAGDVDVFQNSGVVPRYCDVFGYEQCKSLAAEQRYLSPDHSLGYITRNVNQLRSYTGARRYHPVQQGETVDIRIVNDALEAQLAGDRDKALTLFTALAARHPQAGSFHYGVALALHGGHRHAEALPVLEQALAANPEVVHFDTLMVETLLALGRPEQALAHVYKKCFNYSSYFNRHKIYDTRLQDLFLRTSAALCEAGMRDPALELLLKAQRKLPPHAGIMLEIAGLYTRINDHKRAEKYLALAASTDNGTRR